MGTPLLMGTRSDLRAAVHQDRVAHGRCVNCGCPPPGHFPHCPHEGHDDWTGSLLIAEERLRQIVDEHYDREHDREHAGPDLAWAAWCYLGDLLGVGIGISAEPPVDWPWDSDAWKPTPDDPSRQLVKAGALIAAEIDRRLAERKRP